MTVVAYVAVAALGLVVGQWMHVLLHRSPIRLRAVRPGYHCANCGVATPRDRRTPIVTLIKRTNACPHCDRVLWPDTPAFEIALAALFVLVTYRVGISWQLPAYLLFFAALLIITVVDYRHYVIPNRILYTALFGCMGLLVLATLAGADPGKLVSALTGMALAWIFFLIVHLFYRAGMGFGDVRLAALLGLLTGWISLANVVLAVLLGLFLGAFIGVALMALKIRGRKDAIPFGPFLALGAALSILFNQEIAALLFRL